MPMLHMQYMITIQAQICVLSWHPILPLCLSQLSTCHSCPLGDIFSPIFLLQADQDVNFSLKCFALILCFLIFQVSSYKLYHSSLKTILQSRQHHSHISDVENEKRKKKKRLSDLPEVILLIRHGTCTLALRWYSHSSPDVLWKRASKGPPTVIGPGP